MKGGPVMRWRGVLHTVSIISFGAVLVAACEDKSGPGEGTPPDKPAGSGSADAPASPDASAPATSASADASAPATSTSAAASASPDPEPALPGNTEGCKEGMVRVTGDYCPALVQPCLEHHEEYERANGNKTVSERCLRYAESRCVSKERRAMDFCIDRYEYPGKVGELPMLLVDWHQAKKRCEDQGKRLCTEDEYNFACEGPEMLPYVYGLNRDDKICNIDKDYIFPDHSKQMLHYERCLKDEWCSGELKRMDQRHRIGETNACVSWAGAIDLNGNVNEWVELPGKDPPDRSGLKGGWWGPVRGRCRPTVTFHKENDYGYEVGFRCCDNASE